MGNRFLWYTQRFDSSWSHIRKDRVNQTDAFWSLRS